MNRKFLKSLKILLVEDEQKIAQSLQNAMGDYFHSFYIASNGVDGLRIFEEMAPDIVITDIMMPQKTGLEMAKEIKELDPNFPIIILSAHSETDKFLNAIDIGIIKYFIKPYDPDDLLEYINSLSERFESKAIALVAGFSFNINSKSFYKNRRYISLSKKETAFLELFLSQDETYVADAETIKSYLWSGEFVSDERLRTFIRRLRTKTSKELVLNLKGRGYQINRLPT
jgi:DNA-binding response OmpR family regulator